MKILVIGGNGMAGHILVRYFREQKNVALFYTCRDITDEHALMLDVTDTEQVERIITAVRPHVIINAVGVLNEAAAQRPIEAYQVNGLLPHRLRQIADRLGARVVHISTDCVFSGHKGQYREDDKPDGTSIYAVTKKLGELTAEEPHLTIRTSIIGPEIRPQGIGLLHWFLRQEGMIQGYRQVWWNGVTTWELARAIHHYLQRGISGLIHLGHPQPIHKHELLTLFKNVFSKVNVDIASTDEPVLNRTLANTRTDADYTLPSYPDMVAELAERMHWR
ncbi:dTDP-4-dehydrorhamnose reductase family protein [Paenibacillus apiarius]|uniref:dTDP-4-dehydrorhamnose reductase n=1 Tax=Paenibacillus apiarius TaxID=46240 RepID=A0ABT4DYN6_9BACL|nr:SDR family oxidoreductase [Paenibacillus apiarius]MCY9516467.1 SDR family oxidoreductase [Paenibacillus apiarius]MCY9522458.1 SDR family oxidoreductase [Paenibacillus apiarius]MCY9554618.1 SDR family oxidoreductase [Paenibacillus apiarius]MCY9556734.1 SDR family oxidoreductase [Paenibacillus apiarius]MCY9686585.1 SDR family oxidoreductase [Paenibacillus apiarius]